MKKLLTRFEQNLYHWNFWTAKVVTDFKQWLIDNGETRIDAKSQEFQNALIMGFAYSYNRSLFNKIDKKGFKW
ncbi:TPA: hypothetical protein ACJ51Q_001802 [Streptococcus suis]|uniref:hypothetical protein n=1 Tax=Streptococcus suis TaxID=1307 RepID=UPI001CF5EBE2|nr:hypothetical protein [Streptococcus suis]MCB2905654.1 hypothetical protein [Streptococcus suis]